MRLSVQYFQIEFIVGDAHTTDFSSMTKLCGAMVQYPDTDGLLFDYKGLDDTLRKNAAHLVVASASRALVSVKPPSSFDADVWSAPCCASCSVMAVRHTG